MIIFYQDTFKSRLPLNVEHFKVTTLLELKNRIKEYYSENEDSDTVALAIYDCSIGESSLVEMMRKYVDFEFVELHIFEPVAAYKFKNIKNYNVVFRMSDTSFNTAEQYTKLCPEAYVHLSDNTSSYFLTFELDDIKNALGKQ